MKLTVENVLKLEQLKFLKVLAGRNGLTKNVDSVSVLEIPKATVFIKEGQLLISAFYSILDNRTEQLNVIRMLNESKASGLILSHVGMILPCISQEMIDLCNELDFPLIVAPTEIAYIDIISPILDSLLEKKNQALLHAMNIYDRMTNLILEEKDTSYIIATLSKLLGKPVYFFNHNNVCASSSHGNLPSKYTIYIKQYIDENFNLFINEKKDVFIPSLDNATKILLSPIASSMMYYGMLIVFNAGTLNDLDYIAIKQTKNALAIITLNKTNLLEYNNVLKHDYINDLIIWNFTDEKTAIKRGLTLGYDVSKVNTAMIMDIFNLADPFVNQTVQQLQKVTSDLYNLTCKELSYFAPDSIIVSHSDKILILLSSNKEAPLTKEGLSKIADQLLQTVSNALNVSISIGIGQFYDKLSSVKISYEEALASLKISNKIICAPKTVFYEDVEIFSMLLKNMDSTKAMKIFNNLMSPIIKYDKENNTQLLQTFKMLIQNDSDTLAVSDIMFLHKNTVLQRRKKIMSLYNYDPFALPQRLQFEYAVMLEKLFN